MTASLRRGLAFTGRTRTRDLVAAPAGGPATATLLAVWTMNQATGPVVDAILGNHGAAFGGLERHVSDEGAGISTGSSFAAAGNGADAWISVPNITQYQQRAPLNPIVRFSVSCFIQPDTAPAPGLHRVFLAKDGPSMGGGFSLEVYNDGGTLKVRGYLANSLGVATWADGDDGDDPTAGIAIAPETAYKVVATYDGTAFKLWVYDDTPSQVGTIAVNVASPGLGGNNAGIAILSYNGGLGPFDGVIDDVALWDGDLDQTEIEALDDARTIEHGAPPPSPNVFTCLLREDGALVASYKDLGTPANVGSTGPLWALLAGGNARYDFTGTVRECGLSGVNHTGRRQVVSYSPSFGSPSHNGACISGGAYINVDIEAALGLEWSNLYRTPPDGVVCNLLFHGAPFHNGLVEGFRSHGPWDCFQNGSGTSSTLGMVIRKLMLTKGLDDGIENDNYWDGLIVDDSYIQTFSCYSADNVSVASSKVNSVTNCIFALQPIHFHGKPNCVGPFFKVSSKSPRVIIQNTIFVIPPHTNVIEDPNRLAFNGLINGGRLHPSSEGNTICYLPNEAYPASTYGQPDASKFNVLTGSAAESFYLNALQDMWDAFPGHRFTYPGIVVDPAAP